MVQRITLREEKILEKWSYLIEGAQGKGKEVFEQTAIAVEQANAPGVKAEMARVFSKAGLGFLDVKLIKSLEAQGKDYLMTTNENIKSMRLLVGAQDYGNNLYISWYLVCEPSALSKVFAAFSGKAADESTKWTPVITNVFMEEELSAYTTLVHHCVLNSVETLMADLGKDFSKVDTKSRGFMGIS